MGAAGQRVWAAAAGLVVCVCALFFANGLSDAALVWIGAIAVLAAALSLAWAPWPGRAAAAYLGCLGGLALWCGLSLLWSASPDGSWGTTNRTLAYLGFAALGVVVGPRLDAVAAAATAVVAAVCGWALLAKCVPALYSDYGRLARLRAPLDDWNMLALVAVAGVVLSLWFGARSRVGGTVLLYLFVVTLLLTYSRFGVALACLAALVSLLGARERVESLASIAVAGGAGAAVFGVALSLDGITSDHQSRHVRAHDGLVFALAVLGGAVVVALAAAAIARVRIAPARRRGIERAAAAAAVLAAVAGLALTIAKADTIWHEFTNPVAGQVPNNQTHFHHLGSGNRWTWWSEAWRGFTSHPLGGTGAGTFHLTDLRYRQSSDITALEPHNVPLQFLSETGIVGFLLLLGVLVIPLLRARGPLGIAYGAFVLHAVVNYDWNFLAVCGPFLFVGGTLVAERRDAPARRPLLPVAAAVVFALGCVYSLAAPWLAQRVAIASLADAKRAHSYDPLNTFVIADEAAFAPTTAAAERYYLQAARLEPTNAEVWFELATFYADNAAWANAYAALSRSYTYDPFGPAGQCGVAATIRRHVGVRTTCRGGG